MKNTGGTLFFQEQLAKRKQLSIFHTNSVEATDLRLVVSLSRFPVVNVTGLKSFCNLKIEWPTVSQTK